MKYLQKIIFYFFSIVITVSCSKNNNNSDSDNCTECSYTIASGETAGTVPTALEGTYNLTYHHAQTGSPFTDGTTAKFTINNNILTVEIEGQECITIKNPIKTSPSENTFKDTCRDNYMYSVSVHAQTGGLNEINLSSISGTWYGQFKQ